MTAGASGRMRRERSRGGRAILALIAVIALLTTAVGLGARVAHRSSGAAARDEEHEGLLDRAGGHDADAEHAEGAEEHEGGDDLMAINAELGRRSARDGSVSPEAHAAA